MDQAGSAGAEAGAGAGAGDAGNQDGNAAGEDGKLKSARADAAKYRKRAEAAETELQRMLDATKTDEQKREEELLALRQKDIETASALRSLRIENAVIKACGEHGIIDPDAAVRMLDHEAIIFDSSGNIDGESVKTALAALAAEKPYLVREQPLTPGNIDAGASDKGSGKADVSSAIRRAFAARMGGNAGE